MLSSSFRFPHHCHSFARRPARTSCPLVVLMLALLATQAAGADVFWAEGEGYSHQQGSTGPDRPPFGSRGACLGSSWGGKMGDFVVYRFRLPTPVADARLQLRYARRDPGAAFWSMTLDNKTVAQRLTLPTTGGWGHVRDDEWMVHALPLGDLASGRHTLRLVSLADRNNTNLDGFFVSSGPFPPPKTRAEIEQIGRLDIDQAYRVDEQLTFEQFFPDRDDPYYPPEEVEQRTAIVVPRLVSAGDGSIVVADNKGRSVKADLGQSCFGWQAVAVIPTGDGPTAVLERHFPRWGLLAYVNSTGTVATIRKAIGGLDRIVEAPAIYPPDYEQTIVDSRRDLLGEKVLQRDDDASFEACVALLPDVMGYTFLGTEGSAETIAVAVDGRLGHVPVRHGRKPIDNVIFDPQEYVPACQPTDAKRGLAGRYLPVVDYGFFDADLETGWEQVAFARGNEADNSLHAFVYLRIVLGNDRTERLHFRTGDETRPISAAEFFSELLQLKRHWDSAFDGAMEVTLPEPRIADACRASLVRAAITFNGPEPRYGLGNYAAERHATFPPTTLSMVNACVEWGLLDRARQHLDYYLDHAVRPDGTFDYYGPAVSEYGQLLDAIARYVRRTGRTEWLAARLPKIENMIQRLRALRQQSEAKFAEGDLRHGLIMGSPEADTREDVDYYFSGDVWTLRGWTEIARLLADGDNEAQRQRGQQLLAECQAYANDVEAGIQRSIQPETQPLFVPPTAGFDKPFDRMTQDRFASYTNYRYWIEMLSSGFLRPQWHDAIIDYRTTHGGDLLGTTRFSGHLDDWPFAGYAYGLLLRDRVRPYLLGFYGDLAVHRMRGTFTAYEQVAIRGLAGRDYMADYCVPAQLVTPLLTKWMLVFEEPDADVLWLCRAVPRRWLAPGEHIAVRRATTRWGLVSFTITPEEDGSIRVTIDLPSDRFPAELRLRLRMPEKRSIHRVLLDGHLQHSVDVSGECVLIPHPMTRRLDLTVYAD